MKVFVIAGEESGDILGAGVMQALQNQSEEDVIFRGIGGARMMNAGLNSLFPMEDLSLMGIAEILPKVPHLLSRIKQTVDAIETFQPDILLTVDAPDFSFRVAKGVKQRGLSVPVKAHYVAPTVWAWRPKRAAKVAGLYDTIFCLFPFEPAYFEKEGMGAVFVGHPISEVGRQMTEDKKIEFLNSHNISKNALKLGVFFGSRHGELSRMGDVFIQSLQASLSALCGKSVKDLNNSTSNSREIVIVAPTLPHLREKVEELLAPLSCEKAIITDKDQKYSAMAACDMALATSGTVGLELSVLDVPHIIGYKVSALTHQIAKRLITTKYAHLSNILLQKEVVPEFIQEHCTPENLTKKLLEMTQDDEICKSQKSTFSEVREMIIGPKGEPAANICAESLIKKLSAS